MKQAKCIVDVLVIIFAALFSYLFWWQVPEAIYRAVVSLFLGLLILLMTYRLRVDIRSLRRPGKRQVSSGSIIGELALLGEEDDIVRTWRILGMPSAIIGKSTLTTHADIDLRDTAFATMVDPEHALLNYTQSGWYIEDNDSRNGISIVKRDQKKYHISKTEPCLLEKGDIIYIANTRLLVQ